MSFFRRLFRRKPGLPPSTQDVVPQSNPSADGQGDAIRAFDAYGRQVLINREEWRTRILPANLKKAWEQPDELYQMILSALNDGFRREVIEAARHLYSTDSNRTRSACMLAIILMEEGDLKGAEALLKQHSDKHGEEGVILTNLAKVFSMRQDNGKAATTLWRALELDPNQEFAVSWLERMHRESSGPAAGHDAMLKLSKLSGSWRAQLWLARAALESRDLDSALRFYQESLSRVGSPTPAGLLVQMSGDLGNHGHLPELLQLTEPRFEIAVHGLQVGNNLIKAHLDLGQVDAARILVDQLYALQRPDWRETLSFWDTEIARTRIAASPVDSTSQLQMEMLAVEGPVWLRSTSPAAELFPAKLQEGPHISFLGCSAEDADGPERVEHQLSATTGRLSRAIPFYLAEHVEFGTNARIQTLVPWVVADTGGFVLFREPWTDEDAAAYACQGAVKSDYVVVVHLIAKEEPWRVSVRLIRTIDGQRLGLLESLLDTSKPEQSLPAFANSLQALLISHAGVRKQERPSSYSVPADANFFYYLMRMEQLLAVRCSAMEGIHAGFLSGERDILDGSLQLCLQWPASLPARLLLAQTVLVMKRVRPSVVKEFREKLHLLQTEQPLSEPAHSVVERMFHDALG